VRQGREMDEGTQPERASRDQIGALLRSVGRRTPVAAERVERVEAVVRAHWQAELRRRRRRAWWLGGAAVAGAAIVLLALAVYGGGPDRTNAGAGRESVAARIEIVVDAAWIRPAANASATALRPGDGITIGSDLATDDRGRVAVRMASGHSVRLDTGTHVRLVSERTIALDRGALYVDSRPASGIASGSVEIQTPLGTIRDIGTQFEVRLAANAVRVRVREGRIAFNGTNSAVDVVPGRELHVGADGAISHVDERIGRDLDWVNTVTPPVAIEGRPLRPFLEWLARERGLRLAWARPELAASASKIVLHGSIEGMTLEQALESVLSTCRMSAHIDGNALIVQPATEVTP
jgi:ferric-dicitrate binding protein FerR (iron transport regulator)